VSEKKVKKFLSIRKVPSRPLSSPVSFLFLSSLPFSRTGMQKCVVLESFCVLSAELAVHVRGAGVLTPQVCHLLDQPVPDPDEHQGPEAQQPATGGDCAEAH